MRTRTRLVTTAGVTVLGFTAMSGMAQADTGGLGLSSLTSPLTKTLGGVVNQAVPTSSSSSRDSGTSLNLPVHVHVGVPSTPRTSTASDDGGRWRSAARSRGSAATADVDAAVNASPRAAQVRASVGLCASLAEECGAEPSQPNPPSPPNPPGQPPQAPGGKAPTATGSITATGKSESLPFTGGPIGSLAFLGVLSVLTGAAGVGASRLRVRRES
jgi:hypothetical protein